MGAADLRDRVVPVAEEHTLIELRRALPLGPVEGAAAGLDIPRELLQVETAEGSGIARVPGEQRSLDRFGEIDEREDRTVRACHRGANRDRQALADRAARQGKQVVARCARGLVKPG